MKEKQEIVDSSLRLRLLSSGWKRASWLHFVFFAETNKRNTLDMLGREGFIEKSFFFMALIPKPSRLLDSETQPKKLWSRG